MYFNLLQLCVYIVTWNVNSKFLTSNVAVNNLFSIDENQKFYSNHTKCTEPDLYVIGLQEVDSRPANYIARLFQDDIWIQKFQDTLSLQDFITIKVQQMQGLLIVVFTKRKHLLHIKNIESDTTKTGFGGLWGNKGATSIRMNLYGNSLTFVNTHLPAHDEQLDKRIKDYHTIINNHHYHTKHFRYILDHDYVLWFGDLNFRLNDFDLQPKYIKYMILDNRLDELLVKDQLITIRKDNEAFNGFYEEKLKFPPTFKYYVGTSDYNLQRRPAWTDRILYKVKDDQFYYTDFKLGIEQLSYQSHPIYTISDHKPVTGHFLINILNDNDDVSFSEKLIKFSHINMWYLGNENLIEYTIPNGYEEKDGDWIGIYPKDFKSLSDYIAYEYSSHSKIIDTNLRHLSVAFSENVNFKEEHDYVILYFQSVFTRSINSVVGISNEFKAKRE